MSFGFSWIGAIFLIALWIPNIIWARNLPVDYHPGIENKALLVCERAGQVATTGTALLLVSANALPPVAQLSLLVASIVTMLLYEAFWVRYFRGKRTMADMYKPLLGIPYPGATLPIIAFILLGISSLAWPLIISAIILGIGHIGIHRQHQLALS